MRCAPILGKLSLSEVDFTEKGIDALKQCPKLKCLNLRLMNPSDSILEQLAKVLPQLTYLGFWGAFRDESGQLTEKGFSALATLPLTGFTSATRFRPPNGLFRSISTIPSI